MTSETHNSTVVPSTYHATTLITSLDSTSDSIPRKGSASSVPSIIIPTTSNLGGNGTLSIPIHTHSTSSASGSVSSDDMSYNSTLFHAHGSGSSVEGSSTSSVFESSGEGSGTSLETDPVTNTITSEVTTAITSYVTDISYPEETTVYYTQPFYFTDDSTTITTNLPYSTVIETGETFATTSLQPITTNVAYLASVVPGYKSTLGADSNGDSSSSKKTIAGSVVGSVMGCGIILLVIWFFLQKRRKKSSATMEKGFSHSVPSTRRYDDSEPQFSEKPPSPPRLHSFIPFSRSSTSSESSAGSNDSSGLGSLRTSILKDQQVPNERTPITSHHTASLNFKKLIPTSYNKRRTIDTVFEESESSSSTIESPRRQSQPQSTSPLYHNRLKPTSQRYQNSGLKPLSNPFQSTKTTPPPPPPSRRSNAYPSANDFIRGHGNNRHSLTSIESSIVSEDTDDISTDESLIEFGEDGMPTNNGSGGGFFKEVV